jgi:predicted ATPase
MIAAFRASGLKAFDDVGLGLQPLTVLVGPNGAGKTTLLDGLAWLLHLAARPAASEASTLGAAGTMFQGPLALSAVLHKPDATRLTLEATRDDGGTFAAQLSADAQGALLGVALQCDAATLRYPFPADSDGFFALPGLAGLAEVARLRLDARALGAPSMAATHRPTLRDDGAGLPTLLQFLAGERDGRLERIESDLRGLVPTFRRVSTLPTTLAVQSTELVRFGQEAITRTLTQQVPAWRLLLEFEGAGRVPAEHTSEGTLLALALLTALHASPVRTLLVDDIDRALHPAAQARLMDAVAALMRERPTLQVVCTTHSPDLVDACPPESVRVLGRDDAGVPHVAALTAHPDAPRWLRLLRVGEFWSTVGEQWVAAAGSRP